MNLRQTSTLKRTFSVTRLLIVFSMIVAPLMPSPQMAQTAAQRAGLGDWFANAAARLTAAGQWLWGAPHSAQAASFGTPIPLLSTTHGATIATALSLPCTALNCFVTNSANVVDANTANAGNLSIPLGLLGGVTFRVKTTTTFPAGYRAGFLIDKGSGLIDLSLFSSFALATYLNGVQQDVVNSPALMDVSLFGGPNANAVSFVTSKPFDEVLLKTGSLASLLLNMDVYYAFVQAPVANATAGPGGVGTGLKVWLRADSGVAGADGSSVAVWNDSSANAYNVAQGTAAQQPKFYSTTASKLVNFNPSLEFDGVDDYLINTTAVMPGTGPYSWILALTDEAADTGFRQSFTSQDAWDWFGFYKFNGASSSAGFNTWSLGFPNSPVYVDKATKYSPSGGSNGYWNGTNYTSDSRTQNIQPQIIGLNSANSSTTDALGQWVDGYKNVPQFLGQNNNFTRNGMANQTHFFKSLAVGTDWSGAVGAEWWKGKIPEVIAFSQNLSDADMQRVNTYLAIKYGMTLGQGNGAVGANAANVNYVATDGTTVIWNGTTNTTYKNNIAGIGRDDAEALNQKQSQSVNAGFQPTLGLGAIAATNAANTNAFGADKSYLVWGDNGATASFGTAYAPNSFTPANGYYRMARAWRVQKTGTVGAVTLKALSTSADHLLVSTNPAFPPASTTEVAMTGGSGSYTFNDGDYFTFGAAATAPGGVNNGLALWTKANVGVFTDLGSTPVSDGDTVQQWSNSADGGVYNVTQATAGTRPTYYDSTASKLLNFNPSLSFAGAQELFNSNRLYSSTAGWRGFSIAKDLRTSTNQLRASMGLGDNANDPGFDLQTDGVSPNGWNPWMDGSSPAELGGGTFDSQAKLYNGNTGGHNQQPQIFSLGSTNLAGGTSNIVSIVDGLTENTDMDSAREAGIGGGIWIGSSGGEQWVGLIGENAVYSRELSVLELNQVNSYFAIKYGITLDSNKSTTTQNFDYVASDGTTIAWPGTLDSTYQSYHNDVAGIGRDDASGLYQPKSQSVNTDFQPIIEIPGTFGVDKTFLMWGDNAQPTSFATTYSPTSFTPTGRFERMARVWKVKQTGTVGTVQVRGPSAFTDYVLADDDGNFGNGGTAEIPMSNGEASVDFTAKPFFTFGRILSAATCSPTWIHGDNVNGTAGLGIAAWKSLGNGSFSTTKIAFSGFNPASAFGSGASYATYFADVDNDGDMDAVQATESGGNHINVWLNNGDNTFQANSVTTSSMQSVTDGKIFAGETNGEQGWMADTNGDGNVDYIFSGDDNNIHVYLGNGDGTFAITRITTLLNGATGYHASGVSASESFLVADVDGDNSVDLIGTFDDSGTGRMQVWLGNGDGTFNSNVYFDTLLEDSGTSNTSGSASSEYSQFADTNGDGLTDYIHAENYDFTSQIWVYLNNGNGTFQTQAILTDITTNPPGGLNVFANYTNARSSFLADVNNDGLADYVTGADDVSANNGLSVYLNQGNNQFSPTPINTLISSFAAGLGGGETTYLGCGILGLPKFAISQSTPTTATQNTNFNYTLTVTNTGVGSTSGVVVVMDTLPIGVSFVSGSGSGFTCAANGQDVTCTSSVSMAPGGIASIVLVVNPTAVGVVTNTFTANGGGAVATATSNSVNTTVSAVIVPSTVCIWDNGTVPGSFSDGVSSDRGAPIGAWAADDFQVASACQVVHLTFWGAHAGGSPSENFSVRFYTGNGTHSTPGSPAINPSTRFDNNIAYSATLTNISKTVVTAPAYGSAFKYEADLAVSVTLSAGYYWLSINNQTAGATTEWSWLARTPQGGGNHHTSGTGFGGFNWSRTPASAMELGFALASGVSSSPDLTTTIGQPSPNFVAGLSSNIPVTVTNSGTGSTTGPITTALTLPNANFSVPASFTSNGNTCTTTGMNVICVNPGPIAAGGSNTIQVPVTPNASAVGTTPAFNSNTATPGETNTGNNAAMPMTPSVAVIAAAAPDLTTAIGQPSPNFVAGSPSNVSVTVTNSGTGPTTEPITATITLPAGMSAPANFSNNGWSCTTSGPTVTCATASAINNGASSIFTLPVTPNASTVGSTPAFTVTTAATAGETNVANNGPVIMTPTAAITAGPTPDLTTTVGQPSPALVVGTVSAVPVTVTNIGTSPTTGPVTATLTLPPGVTTPIGFSSNGWSCATAGQVVTCSSLSTINNGGSSTFSVPATPDNTTVGGTPVFTGTILPTVGETNTANNGPAAMIPTSAVAAAPAPDLISVVGQPAPAFVAGIASNVPITVTNAGNLPTTGPITATIILPTGTSAPASFASGPWTCTTNGQTVTCVSNGPIAAAGSSTIPVPVTANASTVGTTPGPFTGTLLPTAGETNIANNNPSNMTPSVPVALAPVPPVAPTINNPTNNSAITNTQPTISGIGTPGALITVTESPTGTVLCTTTVGAGSLWSCIPGTPLSVGSHTLNALAGNANGASPASAPVTVMVDTAAPAAPAITSPAAGSTVNDNTPLFNGTAEPGSTVVVKDGATTLCTAVVDNSGNWSCSPAVALTDGPHIVAATATDPAGNVGPVSPARNFSVATTPDLLTSIGNPQPALQATVPSTLPVTISNIGVVPTNGPITTTLALPPGMTAPASFTSGLWVCTASQPPDPFTVSSATCVSSAPIPVNGSSTINLPVTPNAVLVGFTPTFNAVSSGGGEANTSNNAATPLVGSAVLPVARILPIKAFLYGPYNVASGVMSDGLRLRNLIPIAEPYAALGFARAGGSGETTTAAVLAVPGSSAVVDWVLVELRDSSNPATLVTTKAALLLRNGSVKDVDGTSDLSFTGLTQGSYFVALRHRNHLGVMTASPVVLAANTPVQDFTTMSATQVNGTNARRTVGSIFTLWAGNANGDSKVQAAGANNDLSAIVSLVLNPNYGNNNLVRNWKVNGYYTTDVNLDGDTLASGANNDVAVVVNTINSNPINQPALNRNTTVDQRLP